MSEPIFVHSFYHNGNPDGHEYFVTADVAPFWCYQGSHRSDMMGRMTTSALNEATYSDGSL